MLSRAIRFPGSRRHEFAQFRLGLTTFTEVESVDDGLGPAFNGTSCAACHNAPVIGGITPMTEIRAGTRLPDGTFRPLDASGNTLFQLFSLPNHTCQPVLPPEANVVARRMPLPLFGAGLVEAIPDDTLLALADPLDRNGDGVPGRASVITDAATGQRRVGRFGWKAQIATLLTFAGDAYRNEMGITNDVFPTELAFGIPADRLKRCDVTPEPEDKVDPLTGRRDIDNFASFMRFLAPIARGPIDATVRDGELVFAGIGCAACHMPALTTGPSVNPLFNRKVVRPVLRSAAPRHRNRRRHPAERLHRDAGRDPDAGAVGPAHAAAVPARRERGHRRSGDRTPPARGGIGPRGIRSPGRSVARRAARVPAIALNRGRAVTRTRGRALVPHRACRIMCEGL